MTARAAASASAIVVSALLPSFGQFRVTVDRSDGENLPRPLLNPVMQDNLTQEDDALVNCRRRIGPIIMLRLTLTALLVKDYDDAIAFFVGKLGFEVTEDTQLSADKRWVVVAPRGGDGSLLLARATDDRQRAAIGEQSGGRVFLFLETDDFARDHADYSAKGVTFVEEPRHEPYGTVAVFMDLYGNRWDLIQPASAASPGFGPEED